jgi:exopolyphosphatase/guanosine-5'-triphosphate,3'-diphosphate pyrophosphatase
LLCKGKSNTSITIDELDSILKKLESRSYEDRILKFKLRPDRADVIIPATIALQNIAYLAHVERILIPRVGIKDGLLIDMASRLQRAEEPVYQNQAISSAKLLGRKYDYQDQHSMTVARFAVQLFDSTKKLHKLGGKERTLLEVAGLLHDIGYYVGMTDHHKHSYYLIKASPIIGLDDSQREIVAMLVRYHSRALPKLSHKEYEELPSTEQSIVTKLAPLLRLAEALDREHANKVKQLRISAGKKLTLRLRGRGDLSLERWALVRNSELFETVYRRKVVIA